MAVTTFNDIKNVQNMVAKYWSPMFSKELRENTLWMNFVDGIEKYRPDLVSAETPIKMGDTFYVNTITKPSNTVKTWGTDANSFDSTTLTGSQSTLVVNKRAVSSFEFEDIAVLASQLNSPDGQSQIRAALLADCMEQVNDYIKSIINPSAAAPDHVVSGVTDFTFAQLSAIRTLSAAAKWGNSGEAWRLAVDPSYLSDLIDETSNSSNDFNGGDTPVLNGAFRSPRLGYGIFEDNSLTTDVGYAFINSWAIGAFGQPTFDVERLLSNKQFGYIIVAKMDFGVVQHDNKRIIKIYNS